MEKLYNIRPVWLFYPVATLPSGSHDPLAPPRELTVAMQLAVAITAEVNRQFGFGDYVVVEPAEGLGPDYVVEAGRARECTPRPEWYEGSADPLVVSAAVAELVARRTAARVDYHPDTGRFEAFPPVVPSVE